MVEEEPVHSKMITYDQLAENFHLPINEVSKKLGICTTVLKKVCRRNGIPRWPYRKLKAIDKKIQNLQISLQKNPHEAKRIEAEIEVFKERKRTIIKNPSCLSKKANDQDGFDEASFNDMSGSAMLMGLTPNNSYPPIPITPTNHQIAYQHHPSFSHHPNLSVAPAAATLLAHPQPSLDFQQVKAVAAGGSSMEIDNKGGDKNLVVASNLVEMLSQRNLQQSQAESGHAVGFLPFYGHNNKVNFSNGKPSDLQSNLLPPIEPSAFFSPEERSPPIPRSSGSLGLLRPFFSEPISAENSEEYAAIQNHHHRRLTESYAETPSAGLKRSGRDVEALEMEARQSGLYCPKRIRSNPSSSAAAFPAFAASSFSSFSATPQDSPNLSSFQTAPSQDLLATDQSTKQGPVAQFPLAQLGPLPPVQLHTSISQPLPSASEPFLQPILNAPAEHSLFKAPQTDCSSSSNNPKALQTLPSLLKVVMSVSE